MSSLSLASFGVLQHSDVPLPPRSSNLPAFLPVELIAVGCVTSRSAVQLSQTRTKASGVIVNLNTDTVCKGVNYWKGCYQICGDKTCFLADLGTFPASLGLQNEIFSYSKSGHLQSCCGNRIRYFDGDVGTLRAVFVVKETDIFHGKSGQLQNRYFKPNQVFVARKKQNIQHKETESLNLQVILQKLTRQNVMLLTVNHPSF